MRIAVLSGKGGTGKTTVSACLALARDSCRYMDCDVEEPNGAVFLNPDITESEPVSVKVPVIDDKKCSRCGRCADVCQFNAIAVIRDSVLLFPELCHHCGACAIVCPEDAIDEADRVIGVVERNEDGTFIQGKLNVSEPVSIPIIQKLKKGLMGNAPVVIDCPPGASCTVVESIEGCDYCILVTEPTPFGLHDLDIAVRLVDKMDMPFGVVVNKASDSTDIIDTYCSRKGIELLMKIPFSRKIAEEYSRGLLPVRMKEWKDGFAALFERVERGAAV